MTARRRRCARLLLLLPTLATAGCLDGGGGTNGGGGPADRPSASSLAPSVSPTSTLSQNATPVPLPTTLASPSHQLSPKSTVAPESSTGSHPVIVIDPGHSGRTIRSRTTNGLLDYDYPNHPEITEMFDVSSCVASGLRADGYRVVLTKTSVNASVSHTERAAIANRAHAALAISVHDDHSQSTTFEATYSQRGVATGGRYPVMYRGTGSRRTVFALPAIARTSARYATIIAERRSQDQGRHVGLRQNSFNGRPPLEPGNLALVQLLAKVPWVYNEMGARAGGSSTRELSLSEETGYAKGLLDGVESAVPRSVRFAPTSTATIRSCLQRRRG